MESSFGMVGCIIGDGRTCVGLRERRVTDIVVTAGLRLVWRMCHADTPWSCWMKNDYLKGKHISEAQISLLDSGTWKWIYHSKRLYMTWQGNWGMDNIPISGTTLGSLKAS